MTYDQSIRDMRPLRIVHMYGNVACENLSNRGSGFLLLLLNTVSNYNVTDWSIVGALTAIGYPIGYASAGNPSPPFARLGGNMARPTAVVASALGGLAGFMMAYQNSWGRLTGYAENSADVASMKS